MAVPDPSPSAQARHNMRRAWLLVYRCVAGFVAVIGNVLSERQTSFPAIPAADAVGWL